MKILGNWSVRIGGGALVLLLLVALAAVLQVVSGRRVFTGSVIPRLIALVT